MRKFMAFIAGSKEHITMYISILAAIVSSTWYLSSLFDDMQETIRHSWSDVHMRVWISLEEMKYGQEFVSVDEVNKIIGDD